jgi:DNA-binding response OmpR family regulator
MNLLIVEDDNFKFERVEAVVKKARARATITRQDNVRSTVMYLQRNRPDKMVLDMSLPTNAIRSGQGSPQPMPMGGVEILLELRRLRYATVPVLVLTQYPDFEIDGENVEILDAASRIAQVYSLPHVVASFYDDLSDRWESELENFLRE